MCACTHVDTRSTAQPASPSTDAPHGTRARTRRVSEMTKPLSSLYHRLSAEHWPAGAVHDDKHIDLFLVRWRRHDRCQAWRREQSRRHAARHRAHHGRVRRHVVGRPWRATGTAHRSVHPIDLRVGGRMRVCVLELPQKNGAGLVALSPTDRVALRSFRFGVRAAALAAAEDLQGLREPTPPRALAALALRCITYADGLTGFTLMLCSTTAFCV